jgi:anti-sigma factor RsiW
MSHEPANADPALEEQLVAYLDGELDAEASRRLEELLATDPEVRQTLQQLDRTWELLSELDAPEVAERFTQSTLEMVTSAATEDAQRSRAEAPRRRRRRWAILGGSLLAAGLAGFLTMALLRQDPNQQLINDLPLLENFDQYRQIDDIEFLRTLQQERLFAQEEGDE